MLPCKAVFAESLLAETCPLWQGGVTGKKSFWIMIYAQLFWTLLQSDHGTTSETATEIKFIQITWSGCSAFWVGILNVGYKQQGGRPHLPFILLPLPDRVASEADLRLPCSANLLLKDWEKTNLGLRRKGLFLWWVSQTAHRKGQGVAEGQRRDVLWPHCLWNHSQGKYSSAAFEGWEDPVWETQRCPGVHSYR